MTSRARRRSAAVLAVTFLLSLAACDSPVPTTPTRPPPAATGLTLSGQVFDLTPQGRIPAPAGIGLNVNVLSGNCPGIPCSNRMNYRHTETGPDGRYSISDLPAGSAVLFAHGTHQLVCGAFTPLSASTELDLEVTSKTNPQPPLEPAQLRVTGQVYETTPAGRVGVAGAYVYFDWFYESFFFGVQADGDGRYAVCGIPSGWQMSVGSWQEGFGDGWYGYTHFHTDTTFDIELTRRG